ncbi:Transmembrane protein 56 [Hondaea fermentalgiana]|uniref:Transmembrane protein 56 n=1 Tax=Hondaea fermentalgiana TaxID=2315210 RepID=A0A2R5GRF4_9STRA|nr:Transmembrane protein 56 [Hondaea fermentalgiana]|eukprot:GBG30464.1 Transmembrane protein 56 [Hondaea fermentalgiana]
MTSVESLQAALAPLEPWLGGALEAKQIWRTTVVFVVFNVLYQVTALVSARFSTTYKTNNAHRHNRPQSISHDEKVHWNAMVLSFVHSVTVSCLCSSLVLFPDESIEIDRAYGRSERAMLAFSISCGFFLYDTKNCFKSTGPQWPYIFHHVACFFCYNFVQYPFLQYYAVRFLLFELSTPFMNIRSLMLLLGRKGTPLFQAIERSFALSFLIVRILMGVPLSLFAFYDAYVLYESGKQHSTPVMAYFCFANAGLNALNLFWMSTMVQKWAAKSE